MHRLALIPIAGGVVLLVSWIAAPAAPRPIAADDASAALTQSTTAVDDINAQIDRLRERLATPPSYPAPSRNPFRFVPKIETRRARPAVDDAATPEPEPPAPDLPVLVAIVSSAGPVSTARVESAPTYSAVLRVGDDVRIVKSGDTLGPFSVRAVTPDAIDLVHSPTSRSYRIVLQ